MDEIKALRTTLHSNVSSPFVAEGFACLQATKLGILMGLSSVTIMGNLKIIIKKCQTIDRDKSVIGAIIRYIQNSRSHFQEIAFRFIQRSENIQAHKLPKEALEKREELYLVREALNCNETTLEERWPRNPD
ncbi:hypothetical protein J1N35_030335 [Gossypium stocksii]|uniref:RNase H type-1 domain-containing protein n=1 Tax=Gossypium stocksii TaxID=47602 RepID=A0A9D3ZTS8_9ROSI|nr:hypothetical protein J1N35_030335 [Gossypium stocksii]